MSESSTELSEIWAELRGLGRSGKGENLLYCVRQAGVSLLRNSAFSIASMLNLAVLSFLLLSLIAFYRGVSSTLATIPETTTVSFFFFDFASAQDIENLRSRTSEFLEADKVTFVSKKDALDRLRKEFGAGSVVVAGLEKSNPLPASLELEIDLGADPEQRDFVRDRLFELEKLPFVESLGVNWQLSSKRYQTLRYIEKTLSLGLLLSLVLICSVIINMVNLSLMGKAATLRILLALGISPFMIIAPFAIEAAFLLLSAAFVGTFMHRLVVSLLSGLMGPERFEPISSFFVLSAWTESGLLSCVILFSLALSSYSAYNFVKRYA